MSSKGSVTNWLSEMKRGDDVAAQKLWERYFESLVRLARRKLGDQPRGAADEEDVVVKAFDSFFRATKAGRFPQLDDRDDLWRILVMITARKTITQIKHENTQKKGGGHVRSALLEQIVGDDATPAFAALIAEEYARLLELLDDSVRDTAVLKLEGYKNREVADKLNCSVRSVERKLFVIRKILGQESSE